MNYKIQLTTEQKAYVWDNIKTVKRSKKIFSIWQYLIQHRAKKSTLGELYRMYKKNHMKTARTCFYDIVKFIDAFIPFSDKKADKKADNLNPAQPVENTNVEASKEISKPRAFINTNTNTLYTDETVAPVMLVLEARKMLKELKIKSKKVEEIVISKLRTRTNINKAGMASYITSVIASAKAKQEQLRLNYTRTLSTSKKELSVIENMNNAKKLKFNNFEGRNYTNTELSDLEEALSFSRNN